MPMKRAAWARALEALKGLRSGGQAWRPMGETEAPLGSAEG